MKFATTVARRLLQKQQFNNASALRLYSSTSVREARLVIAVGGNALQRRGERLTIENQLKAVADMAPTIAKLAQEHEVVLTHGNGPQVGELALERSAATFDVLGAESIGQIGYVLAQALASAGCKAVPILTQVVVDPTSEAFRNPNKFVGPVYGAKEAHALAESLNWVVKPDGEYFRRVVPSPPPLEILQLDAIRTLLEENPDVMPIACGGGGIPVSRIPSNPQTLQGVEAVIDKDRCGSKLARDLDADGFIILTDGGGIWKDFGKPTAKEMAEATPEYLLGTKAGKNFPGSMGPKIEAAIEFVEKSKSGAWAAIGDLKDCEKIIVHEEGTLIKEDVKDGVIWRDRGNAGEAPPAKLSKEPHKSG
mmetsp:Transcript_25959/g.36581  ORF Transcript_25959/g.36581 Transcript_25959/m.36581 type:complete len:365 (+) Transcript_25959:126-1220(+)